jgi:hypothetical protein
MKFLVTKELSDNKLLREQVLWLTAILVLFLFMDLVLHHYKVGLNPSLVIENILGNEEAFIEPILFSVLLENIHIDLFISMLTLMLLVAIFIRVVHNPKTKLIHLAFLSAILAPLSLLLGYFYGEVFINLWIVFFVLWHLTALYFALTIFRKL